MNCGQILFLGAISVHRLQTADNIEQQPKLVEAINQVPNTKTNIVWDEANR